jgi:hypothetical protein
LLAHDPNIYTCFLQQTYCSPGRLLLVIVKTESAARMKKDFYFFGRQAWEIQFICPFAPIAPGASHAIAFFVQTIYEGLVLIETLPIFNQSEFEFTYHL